MFYWIYDIPAFWVIVLFEVVFVVVCWLGTLMLRPSARSWLREEPRLNDMLAAFLQYFGIIYGLLLGLLAVATYQNRLDVEKSNANEASSLSALYRNVTAYPEPSRTELQNLLKEHTRYLIEDAWPQQRKGIVPVDESHRITTIQTQLAAARCFGAAILALCSVARKAVIAVIALMDRPYRGELGLSPEAFQLIYHGVMHQ